MDRWSIDTEPCEPNYGIQRLVQALNLAHLSAGPSDVSVHLQGRDKGRREGHQALGIASSIPPDQILRIYRGHESLQESRSEHRAEGQAVSTSVPWTVRPDPLEWP